MASPATAKNTAPQYLPGVVMVKVEDPVIYLKRLEETADRDKNSTTAFDPGQMPFDNVQQFMSGHGLSEMDPVFREGASTTMARYKRAGSQPGRARELALELERTYHLRYTSGIDPAVLSRELAELPGVVYAEPYYVHETTSYTPNDPFIGEVGHDYFEYQNFFNAWSVSQGSEDVVIAIVDSGVYYDHPDLIGKLWRNPQPGRARDYFSAFGWEIENDTIGWNFWESGDVFSGEPPVQNGNPVGNYSTHGTHVAGTAAADTDNGAGIAGTGFHARFMPVKVGGTRQYDRSIAYGYPGIIYAAINEADVINCSFGGTGRSEFGSDAVALATALGSLVVAAAGNNGQSIEFFPAAFDDVLTVGSVRNTYDDVKSQFSNFGFYVDVFAMGEGLMSTVFTFNEAEVSWLSGYGRSTGTSMAAPVVSGLAALLKAENPDWTPQRIANQIRSTARSIDQANPNIFMRNRLGKGLIDAHAALTARHPALRISDFAFQTADGDKISPGQDGVLTLTGTNFGEPVSGVAFSIADLHADVTAQPLNHPAGLIDTDDEFTVSWEIAIDEDFRLDEIPVFRVNMSHSLSRYSDFFVFEYERLLFDILDINTITTSLSSDGTIGFMDALTSYGGVGFIPGNYPNILYEGGLMISADIRPDPVSKTDPYIINQVRDSTGITRHFLPTKNYRFIRPPAVSDLDGEAVFWSTEHPKIRDLSVEMESFVYNSAGLDKTLLLTYRITNHSLDTYENMHVGLFNDWDIRDAGNDRTGFVEQDSLIYAYDPQGAPYVAVANMGAVSSAFAIDNLSGMTLRAAQNRSDSLRFGLVHRDNQPQFDGFTDQEKRLALTAGTERTVISHGTDISIVTASGPFTLHPQASITTGFIYAWGDSVQVLRNQVAAARNLPGFDISTPGEYSRFHQVGERTALFQNYPNPFNSSTTFEFHIQEPGPVELAIYNILGQRVATLVDGNVELRAQFITFDATRLASGIYIAVLRADNQTETIKMSLIK